MGRFIYDTMANSVDIDDRTLAHLRIVVMNKLRRTEAFMFDVEVGDGSGRRSFWMHPSVPIALRVCRPALQGYTSGTIPSLYFLRSAPA